MKFLGEISKILYFSLIISCGSLAESELINRRSVNKNSGSLDRTDRLMSNLSDQLDKNNPVRSLKLVEDGFVRISGLLTKDEISLSRYFRYLYQTQDAIEKAFQSSELDDDSKGICLLYVKDTSLISKDLTDELVNTDNSYKLIVSRSSEIAVSSCHDFFVKNIGESYSKNLESFALSVSVRSNIK